MNINYDVESYAIPFNNVKEVLDLLEYASPMRVMFEMLALTGCRISELDNMKVKQLFKGSDWFLIWKAGKNQAGHRREKIPTPYIKEIAVYRERNRTPSERLFSKCSNSFRRDFNKFVRPKLSSDWRDVRPVSRVGSVAYHYVLQLKGLRKNFQTLLFAKEWRKWHDATFAMEKTSKRMRHSSTHITVHHYIENFERLDINKYVDRNPADLLTGGFQTRIIDY